MKLSSQSTLEALVVRRLPAPLERQVGRVAVLYSNLENIFTILVAIILRLHKVEARLVVQTPRIQDRLDIVQDLLALKGFTPNFDFNDFREQLADINGKRNDVVHGIWLKNPEDGSVHLRLTRGYWTKQGAHDPRVRRVVFPESIPMTAANCAKIAKRIENAIRSAENLGAYIDQKSSPERFQPRAPLVDPLARRIPRKPKGQHPPSVGKSSKLSKKQRRSALIKAAHSKAAQ